VAGTFYCATHVPEVVSQIGFVASAEQSPFTEQPVQ
jgi:hypothetical protein